MIKHNEGPQVFINKVHNERDLINIKRWLTKAGDKCSLRFQAKLLADHNKTSKTFVADPEWFSNYLELEDKS